MAKGNAAQQANAGLPPLNAGGTAAQSAVNNVGSGYINPITTVPWAYDSATKQMKTWDISSAKKAFPVLSDAVKIKMYDAMDKTYGKGNWKYSDVTKGWSSAVDQSSARLSLYNQWVTPEDVFINMLGGLASNGLSAGGTAISGGVGGTSHAIQKSVKLTDPSTARGLVDNALSQHLGRQATAVEQQAFLKALNVQEQKAPTITEQTTTTSGKSSSSTSTTTGGFNASTFADEYAAGQQGAGEFQAATSLLDSFIGALGAKV